MNPFTRYSSKTFRIGFISTMKSKGNKHINKTTVQSNKTHSLQQLTANNTPHIHSISQFWALSNFSPFYLNAFIWLFVAFFLPGFFGVGFVSNYIWRSIFVVNFYCPRNCSKSNISLFKSRNLVHLHIEQKETNCFIWRFFFGHSTWICFQHG